jgi:hypothetical protein
MSTLDADSIYALFPAIVRSRDSKAGGALKALIGILADQAAVIDDNLAQLYDDLFIQTCAPWAIPYIGDLIGYRALRPIPPTNSTARTDVADTIGFRRRKGTLTVLDQLSEDVTGWPTVAVEFFQELAVSQYVRDHLRPANACVDVHSWQSAADFNTAFDRMTRTADVRRIESGSGRYNIPNVGVFVWRLRAFGGATLLSTVAPDAKVAMSTAARVGSNRYTFDPFGDDVPLVNPPQPLAQAFLITQRANVPFPLPRFGLYLELEALRAGHPSHAPQYFGIPPVLVVWDTGRLPIAAVNICVCDLSDWTAPTDPNIRVAVDPELGRLMFNGAAPPDPVFVAYAYAFSGPYGGGTYSRPPDKNEGPATTVPSFANAIGSAWQSGVFEIADSGSYDGDLTLTPEGPLVVRAADEVRPVVLGQVIIDAIPGGSVTLRGVGIRDGIVIRSGTGSGSSSSSSSSSSNSSSSSASGPVIDTAFTLILEHCTVRGPLSWSYDEGGSLIVRSSLCSTLRVDPKVTVSLSDSSVDAGDLAAIAICAADGVSPCGRTDLSACTVIGSITARETNLIENSLLCGPASFERTQAGCVRYSYVPPGSRTPRRFRCQPDLAIDAATTAAARSGPPMSAIALQALSDEVSSRLVPMFVSRVPGAAGYLQLADSGAAELAGGAESGDEMGIFHGLYNRRRESNLNFRLSEYLRIGLEAGVIHAS